MRLVRRSENGVPTDAGAWRERPGGGWGCSKFRLRSFVRLAAAAAAAAAALLSSVTLAAVAHPRYGWHGVVPIDTYYEQVSDHQDAFEEDSEGGASGSVDTGAVVATSPAAGRAGGAEEGLAKALNSSFRWISSAASAALGQQKLPEHPALSCFLTTLTVHWNTICEPPVACRHAASALIAAISRCFSTDVSAGWLGLACRD